MKRLWLWLLLLCWSQAGAETRLDQLVRWQRQTYAPAVVTSGFYDARGLSRYRSRPGLHAGYDVAMPAGSGARAAWPGKVRSIVVWAEGEWGVEVMHEDGTMATYGHIVPKVEVGQQLESGQIVGVIARDHLDVKMRDAQGTLFDYGSGWCAPQGVALPPPVVDEAALAFQQRLRQMPEGEFVDGKRWQALKQNGLRVGERTSTVAIVELEKLERRLSAERLRKLSWTERDKERAQSCREKVKALELRYNLGLVSRNQWQAAQRQAQLWKFLE